jgi:membrane associated rhomboid family serine protease
LSAEVHGAPYGSVGASTGIFGAIGALAALQMVRRRRGIRTSAWRVWAPIAAGLGLLGFLGTSPNADLLAHVFGFGVGALLGLIAAPLEAYRARTTLQFTLAAAALLVVLGCWLIALL